MKKTANIPEMIRRYFSEYLPLQRGCSPHTISAYGETFSLLLKYLREYKNRIPSRIVIDDLSVENIIAFLNHLQSKRGNSDRTRNARLATIHSFAKFLLLENPALTGNLHGLLAIPVKRTKRQVLGYLSIEEINAIMSVHDEKTWYGRRDNALFSFMYNTGARVSEAIELTVADLQLVNNGNVRLFGKGRKQRVIPLWKSTIAILKRWVETNCFQKNSPLFPSNRNEKMTRSAVAKRLELAVSLAEKECKSLRGRKVSPHTLRHTTAMHLLQSGVDITVISLWLGHESIETTHIYVTSDMKQKEQALKSLQEPQQKIASRFKADDSLIKFLERLK